MMELTELPKDATLAQVIEAVNRITRHLTGEPEPPPFHDITDELAKHPEKVYGTRALSDIGQIVIHHVGVDAVVSPQTTARYHVRKGWPGIGYAFYVRQDGAAYQTQALETVSYHCGGTCNVCSIGICLEGSFMDGRVPTDAQLGATRAVVGWLLAELGLEVSAVKGHRDVRQTACPGNTWPQWRALVVPGADFYLVRTRC